MTTATASQLSIIVDRPRLATALKNLACVVPARTPKPVLSCVKLTASGGKLNVFATNLELFASMDIAQVDVQAEGVALVNHKKLTAIVTASADGTLTLELDDAGFLTVRGADCRYRLHTVDASEMPPMRIAEEGPTIKADPGAFGAAMAKVTFACSTETSRYAINGVLLTGKGKKLEAVATDGRRLAVASWPARVEGDMVDSIIPSGAIQAVRRIIGDDEEVTITIGGGNAVFAGGGATVATNLVEGNFPPYKDVVPKNHDKTAKVNAEALASLVRRATILTNEESKGVRFAFTAGKLTLTTRAPEIGESEMSCAIEYEGEPLEIGFNPRFVGDALKACGALEVSLELTAANKPMTICADGFLCVVMPVSLN